MNDLLPSTPADAATPATVSAAPAQTAASRAFGEAGSLAFSVIDRQIVRLAEAIESTAEIVQSIVTQADPTAQDTIGGVAGSATDRLRSLAGTIRNQDGRALAGKAQEVIARNSTLAIGIGAAIGALAIGLVARSAGETAPA